MPTAMTVESVLIIGFFSIPMWIAWDWRFMAVWFVWFFLPLGLAMEQDAVFAVRLAIWVGLFIISIMVRANKPTPVTQSNEPVESPGLSRRKLIVVLSIVGFLGFRGIRSIHRIYAIYAFNTLFEQHMSATEMTSEGLRFDPASRKKILDEFDKRYPSSSHNSLITNEYLNRMEIEATQGTGYIPADVEVPHLNYFMLFELRELRLILESIVDKHDDPLAKEYLFKWDRRIAAGFGPFPAGSYKAMQLRNKYILQELQILTDVFMLHMHSKKTRDNKIEFSPTTRQALLDKIDRFTNWNLVTSPNPKIWTNSIECISNIAMRETGRLFHMSWSAEYQENYFGSSVEADQRAVVDELRLILKTIADNHDDIGGNIARGYLQRIDNSMEKRPKKLDEDRLRKFKDLIARYRSSGPQYVTYDPSLKKAMLDEVEKQILNHNKIRIRMVSHYAEYLYRQALTGLNSGDMNEYEAFRSILKEIAAKHSLAIMHDFIKLLDDKYSKKFPEKI